MSRDDLIARLVARKLADKTSAKGCGPCFARATRPAGTPAPKK